MKLIVSADKVKPAMKWIGKNLGPQASGTLNIVKESVVINGKPELTFPIHRKGSNWTLKDLSRDMLDSVLEFDVAAASAEDIAMFNRYLNNTLSDEDAIIFTLKYL